MQGLKAFRLDAAASAENVHEYLGGSSQFWPEIEVLYLAKDFSDRFVVNVDNISESMAHLRALGYVTARNRRFALIPQKT